MKHLWRDEEGATAVEYALIASLIAAVIGAVVLVLGEEVAALFQTMASAWP